MSDVRWSYRITVSNEAETILEKLLEAGIYGRTIPEIIKRIVDARLTEFVEAPRLKL